VASRLTFGSSRQLSTAQLAHYVRCIALLVLLPGTGTLAMQRQAAAASIAQAAAQPAARAGAAPTCGRLWTVQLAGLAGWPGSASALLLGRQVHLTSSLRASNGVQVKMPTGWRIQQMATSILQLRVCGWTAQQLQVGFVGCVSGMVRQVVVSPHKCVPACTQGKQLRWAAHGLKTTAFCVLSACVCCRVHCEPHSPSRPECELQLRQPRSTCSTRQCVQHTMSCRVHRGCVSHLPGNWRLQQCGVNLHACR
jgi:hypothetical protein